MPGQNHQDDARKRHGQPGERHETFAQQGEPERLRLDQHVVQLTSANPAADKRDVETEKPVEQPPRKDGVARHEDDLILRPAADAIKPLGEQQRGDDERQIHQHIGQEVAEEGHRNLRDPGQIHPGVEFPEFEQLSHRKWSPHPP